MRASSVLFIPLSALVLLALVAPENLIEYFPYFFLTLLSGLLLVLPDKKFWRLAWGVCLLHFSILLLLSSREETVWDQLQFLKILNVGLNFGGLFLTWKLNPFPYIDRFFPQAVVPAIRHSLMSPMTFPDHTGLIGQTMDLSETGCKTSFDAGAVFPFSINDSVWAHFPLISDEFIQVRIVAVEKPFLRFEFIKPSQIFIENLHFYVAEAQKQLQSLPEANLHDQTDPDSKKS